jgi:histidinol-phosphatase (PHP family)
MEPRLSFDYHSHHYRCGHARGEIAEFVEAAVSRGMTEFGVSDHGPAYFLPGDHAKPGTQMAISELVNYVAEACLVKEKFSDKIRVRVGIEADFVPGRENDLAAMLARHPLEYVLGSVHYAAGGAIFDRSRWETADAPAVYRDYYAQVAAAARSGLFDILSHLTAVEAFGPPMASDLAGELYPAVADAVAGSGCLVEVNTSGFRKMGGDDPFPNREMLRLLIERNVPLTFGSDCHRPEEVGFGWERVVALLTNLGLAIDPVQVTTKRGTLFAFAARKG